MWAVHASLRVKKQWPEGHWLGPARSSVAHAGWVVPISKKAEARLGFRPSRLYLFWIKGVFCKTYFFVKSLWFYSFLFWYDLVKQAFFYIRKFKKKLKFIDLFMGSFHFFPDCFVLDISLHISSIDFYCEMQLWYTIHFFSFFKNFFF